MCIRYYVYNMYIVRSNIFLQTRQSFPNHNKWKISNVMETPIYLWCSVEVTWCLLRVIAFIDSAKTLRMDPCLIRLLSTPLDFSKEQASMDWWTLRLKKIYAFKIILGNCNNVFTQCEEQQTWLIHPRLECLVCAALEAVPNMLGGVWSCSSGPGRDWIHGHQPPSSRGNLILIQSEGWQHHASTQGQCSPHCMTSGSQSKIHLLGKTEANVTDWATSPGLYWHV